MKDLFIYPNDNYNIRQVLVWNKEKHKTAFATIVLRMIGANAVSELLTEVWEKMGLSKDDLTDFIDAFWDVMYKHVEK